VLSLLLSDVIGDDLDTIGSGPTAPDSTTFAGARAILKRYGILAKVPKPVQGYLEKGEQGDIPETPKPGDPLFGRVQNVVVASNTLAIEAAANEAKELGYRPIVLTTRLEGEAREVARMLSAIALEARTSGRPAKAPVCLLAGGETTVTLRGKGKGGRNQEFALAAAFDLSGEDRVALLAGGTDGTDGPTDAAGAIVDGSTLARARAAGFDPQLHLTENNAYPFFEGTGDLVMTGPTLTNVMDLYLAVVE
jgi:hydroxypyruvate reductase